MPAAELRAEAAARLAEWAACPSTRYLAIATTGLEGVPVEVVVLGAQGQTLLRSLAATDQPIELGASWVHGVGAAELVGAPSLAEVATDLRRVLGSGPVVAFAGPWLGQRFAQAGVRVGAACLSAQPLLSAMCGAYSESHEDFTRVRLGDIVAATGEATGHLAPLGTALGNAQRLALTVRHFGRGGNVAGAEQPEDVESCPDCGAPVHFCECSAPRWAQRAS